MNKSKPLLTTSLDCIKRLDLKAVLRISILGTVIIGGSGSLLAAESGRALTTIPQPGIDYRQLNTDLQQEPVVQLYCWLGSQSCYLLEPLLVQWAKTKQLRLESRFTIQRPSWRRLSKARLVARKLGIEADFVTQITAHLYEEKQLIDSDEALFQWLEAKGIEVNPFSNLFYSAEINNALLAEQQQAKKLTVSGVPTIILKNRWLVDARMAKTNRHLFEILDYLWQAKQ